MSDKYSLIVLPEAQKDIREIVLYIAGELAAPQAALNLQDALQEGINSLSQMPERVKTIDEQPWKEAGVRKIRVRNYYIYFVISEQDHAVKIMAVIYVGRDQENQVADRMKSSYEKM